MPLLSRKYGTSFLYNNKIANGDIIDIMFKKMERMKENLTMTFDYQVRNVSQRIRQIILNMQPTYTEWPPNEEELIKNKSCIPNCLETLIGSIISADRKRSKNTTRLSSLSQNIIYNVHNGQHRTSKHADVAL